MAKKEEIKKSSEEIKNSLEDLSDVIKDLEKDLLKAFDFKRIDKFVDSLTESVKEFDKVSTYTEDIQKNLVEVDKSVFKISKGFGSLKSSVDEVFKSIPTSLSDIQAKVSYINQVPEQPKVEDIQSNIKYNVQDIEVPKIEDIQSNIKFNVQDIEIPTINDINKTITYNTTVPEQPKVEDINKTITYENIVPAQPNVKDINKTITYENIISELNTSELQKENPIINATAKINVTDLGDIQNKVIDINAIISSVDASEIDKTIYKYTPVIIDSIINTPDLTELQKGLKNISAVEIESSVKSTKPKTPKKPKPEQVSAEVTPVPDQTKSLQQSVQLSLDFNETQKVGTQLSLDFNETQKAGTQLALDFGDAYLDQLNAFQQVNNQANAQTRIQQNITDAVTETQRAQENANQTIEETVQLDSTLQAKLNKIRRIGGEVFKPQEKALSTIANLQSNLIGSETAIQKSKIETNRLQDDLYDKNQEIAEQLKEIKGLEQTPGSEAALEASKQRLQNLQKERSNINSAILLEAENLSQREQSKKISEDTVDILSQVVNNERAIGKATYQTLNFTESILDVEDAIIDARASGNLELAAELAAKKEALEIAQNQATAQDKLNSKIQASRDKIVETGKSILNMVPGGTDGFLGKALGLDTISKNLEDNVGNAMANAFQNAQGGMMGFFRAGISGAGAMIAAVAPLLPLLLAIAGIVAIAKIFLDADKAVTQLSKDLGVTKNEAIGVRDAATQISQEMGMLSVTTKEVTDQMIELKKATGINFGLLAQTNDKAREFLETSTMLTTGFGLTAEEGMNLATAAAMAGGSVEELVVHANDLGDELVSTSDLMKDIAKLSKRALENFAKTPAALAGAAKMARMMGTDLQGVNESMEQSLDLFGGMESSLYASLYLGRALDTKMLSYYAHQKDGVNYLKEQKRLLPSLEEYANLGAIGTKKLAAALGLSEEKLSAMMAQKKLLAQIGISEEQMEEKIQKLMDGKLNLSKELAGISDESARAQFKQIVMERQRQSISDKLSATWQKFTDALMKMVGPLIEPFNQMLDSILESSDASGGFGETLKSIGTTLMSVGKTLMSIAQVSLPIISGMFTGISFVLGKIFGFINWIVGGITSIKEAMFGTSDATAAVAGSAESVQNSMGIIKGLAIAIGGIIGLWITSKMITGAIGMFQTIKGTVTDVASSTKNIYTTLTDGGKGFLDTFKKTEGGPLKRMNKSLRSLFGKKGVVTDGKKSEALDLPGDSKAPEVPAPDTAKAEKAASKTQALSQRISKGFKSFNDSLKSIFKGIGDTFKNIFNFLRDTLKSGFDFVKNVLTDAFKMIKSVGQSLTTTLQSLLQNIQTVLTSAVDVIRNVGTAIIQAFGDLISEISKVISTNGVELVNAIGTLIGSIINLIKTQGTALVQAFGSIISEIATVISTNGSQLINAMGTVLGTVIQVINTQGTALAQALGSVGSAVTESVMTIVNTLLDGLGEAAGKLPGIMGSLGSAIGSFFSGLTTGLVTFAQAMAAPTPLFGLPVGLIVLAMAMGLAASATIAAPAISALGSLFSGLGDLMKGVAPVIEAVGTAISSVVEAMGTAISQIITSVADSLVKLGEVNVLNIAALALALPTLAFGLGALTAGSIVSGIASFFGAGPADLLNELAAVDGQSITTTSEAILTLSEGLITLAAGAAAATTIPFISESLDDLSDVDSDDLMSIADSVNYMSDSFEKLSASLAKLPQDAAKRIKGIAEATGQTTGTGLLGSITSSIFGAIDKVKTGFAAVTEPISSSLTSGFDKAYQAVSDWFGQSPSVVGDLVSSGISSVSSDMTSALTEPFTSSLGAVTDFTGQIGGIPDAISSASNAAGALGSVVQGALTTPNVQIGDVSGVENLDKLKNIDVKEINKVIEGLGTLKLDTLEDVFKQLADAIGELDFDALKSFSSLASSSIKDSAKVLQDSIQILVENLQNISRQQLLRLEDSFDLIEDTFAELDVQSIKDFSSLASSDLKAAGKTFAKGINSIAKITDEISVNNLRVLETKFDLIEDAFAELDVAELQEFAKLADSGLRRAGKSFARAIDSLVKAVVDEIPEKSIRILETKFDLIEDAFAELDVAQLQEFASLAGSVLPRAAETFSTGINTLITSFQNINASSFSSLEDAFDALEDALSELDIEQLLNFGQLAKVGLSQAATNLIEGVTKLQSFPETVDLDAAKAALEKLNETLGSINWSNVDAFAKLAESKLTDSAKALQEGLITLNGVPATVNLESFKKALGQLGDAFKVVDWTMFTSFASLADKELKTAALRLIDGINTLTYVSEKTDLTVLKRVFGELNNAFNELDWNNLNSFAAMADAKLVGAAESLLAGIDALTKVPENTDLSLLENALDQLGDAFGEADWSDIETFASLGDKKLVGAAARLIDGITTLQNGIQSEINLEALEDTLSNLNDAFAAADWTAIDTFASMADKDLNKAGLRLIDGINTLYNGLSKKVDMTALGQTLASLNDAFKQIDWKNVESFASMGDKKLVGAATQLTAGIEELQKIKGGVSIDISAIDNVTKLAAAISTIVSVKPEQVEAMATAVNNLASAVNNLSASMASLSSEDIAKMQQVSDALPKPEQPGVVEQVGSAIGGFFSGLFGGNEEEEVSATPNTANAGITPVMQAPMQVNANQSTPAGAAAAGSPAPAQGQSADLKQIADTLKAILVAIDQPTQINLNGQVINSLEKTMNVRRTYNVGPASRIA